MARYLVNEFAVSKAEQLIGARRYVVRSEYESPVWLRFWRLPPPAPQRPHGLPLRATQWDHKEIDLAAHHLIQELDRRRA